MIIVKIKASGAVLTPTQPVVTSGSGGTVRVCFEFDGEWQGLAKTAVFYTPHGNVFQVLENGACEFPAKALESAGDIKVGVFGTDGERTLTSLLCRVRVSQGTTKNAERAANFAPGIYEQLSAKIDKVENIAAVAEYGEEAAAEIKDVDGVITLFLTLPRGEKGEQGEKGDSYVLTDADKSEIAKEVSETSVSKSEKNNVVYARYDNKDTTIPFSSGSADPYSMVRRDSRGCIISADPELDNECATKGYVDGLVGNVETALDNIIALQEAYTGGESA